MRLSSFLRPFPASRTSQWRVNRPGVALSFRGCPWVFGLVGTRGATIAAQRACSVVLLLAPLIAGSGLFGPFNPLMNGPADESYPLNLNGYLGKFETYFLRLIFR